MTAGKEADGLRVEVGRERTSGDAAGPDAARSWQALLWLGEGGSERLSSLPFENLVHFQLTFPH